MSSLDYIELTCKLEPIEPWREILIAQLADIGFDSFEETYEGFKAYIPKSEYNEESQAFAMALPAAEVNPVTSVETADIKGINWNQEWEKNFNPIWVAKRVFIRAPFHAANHDALYEVVIEPKMSFGTGHHETTRLIIEWMLESNLSLKSLLDMGCGTGVLAVLAAKMGASRVVAIDNYIYAYENTRDNMLRNGLSGVVVKHGDASILGDETFDVILANITRNVLLEDLPKYHAVLRDGGVLFLSGFLEADKDVVIDRAHGLGLVLKGEKYLEKWVSLKMVKP